MFAACFLFSFFFFFFFPKKMYWGTIFFCSRFYLSVIYFRLVFLFFILFGEFLCAMWNCGVSTKKKTTQLKKINKIKSPANFSFAAYDMEKLKISVEYVLFCVSRVISEKVFITVDMVESVCARMLDTMSSVIFISVFGVQS